jgi:hypothetical protein
MSETYSIRNPDRLGKDAIIPPMTHPMGRNWQQPDRSCIVIDGKHALMDQTAFDKLLEYNTSVPSGVYEGKMWRSQRWVWEPNDPVAINRGWALRKFLDEWYLHWFGPSDKPGMCSSHTRRILIV